MLKRKESNMLLAMIRNGQSMTLRQQVTLTLLLSLPSMLAQITHILMQYIDASMVGGLGAQATASIGLVSTTIWLFGGMVSASSSGFSVQVAHSIGANDMSKARDIFRQSITATMFFSLMLATIGLSITSSLPRWLGGGDDIVADASRYFFIFILCLPALQIDHLCASMLRCSGNMYIPSMLNIMMCVLDVIFNFLFIFPTRDVSLMGMQLSIPGAGLGVVGAALGTAVAEWITALLMAYFAIVRSPELSLTKEKGSFRPTLRIVKRALHIGLPMGCQHIIMCGAQITSTIIVAPLGTFAIAANSLAVTAESICYMPGYGIGEAATTLVGQSIGASRHDLTWRFSKITLALGMGIMTFMGIVMYFAAPYMMAVMTPVEEVRHLGTMALRIEAFAEPMFAASIVCYGIFVGAGDTLIPAVMNLSSIWLVRISLAAILTPRLGLNGAWIAMCVELCVRGAIFLVRLKRGKWVTKVSS